MFIKKDLKINDFQIEILVGVLNLYCLVGSIVAGKIADWIGRRYTIAMANVIIFAGSLFMGFSVNYAFLMVSRFVAGFGVGFALMSAVLYTAEISPASPGVSSLHSLRCVLIVGYCWDMFRTMRFRSFR